MKLTRSRLGIIFSTVIIGLAITLVMRTQVSQSKYNNYAAPQAGYSFLLTPSPTRPANCAALPGSGENQSERTPTPQRGQGKKAPVNPTATEPPSIQVYDLSPDLSVEEKAILLVFRCKGNYEKFLAGPEKQVPASLHLEDGDVILEAIPPVRIVGEKPQIEPTNPPEPTENPYPAPGTDETPVPYPYP